MGFSAYNSSQYGIYDAPPTYSDENESPNSGDSTDTIQLNPIHNNSPTSFAQHRDLSLSPFLTSLNQSPPIAMPTSEHKLNGSPSNKLQLIPKDDRAKTSKQDLK